MIVELQKFTGERKKFWEEFEDLLHFVEKEPGAPLDIEIAKRFHFLYLATTADLAKISTFSADPGLKRYLENLVSRAYGEIYGKRNSDQKFSIGGFLFEKLPVVFRKHFRYFQTALSIMLAGCLFGGGAVLFDLEAKAVLMPFPHLQSDPSKRVAMEERATQDLIGKQKTSFSSYLITHNIRVAIFVLALGMTWGIGTVAVLFANGVMLGAVIIDYIISGETLFLVGWLLPHGAVEIPAVLLGGQAGLLLAATVIGTGRSPRIGERMREIASDLSTIIFGAAFLLVWAGIVEAFFSQYHEPFIPYEMKIGFGLIEIALLYYFLSKAGRNKNL